MGNGETLRLEIRDRVAVVTLDRADAANALDAPLWQRFVDVFAEIDDTAEARAAVIVAEGRHFCAGIDLSLFADPAVTGADVDEPGRRAARLRRQILEMQESMNAVERCRVPVLAAVHGACIGAGVDLMTACDMRYAAADAYFAVHEINIGMTADIGTLQRLPHVMPAGLARELAYTGRRMGAEEALGCGFVNATYPDRDAMVEDVMAKAREIAAKSPLAVSGSKEMLLYARDHPVADALNYIATWNAGMLSAPDIQAAVRAQAEKAEPAFDDLPPPGRFVRRRD